MYHEDNYNSMHIHMYMYIISYSIMFRDFEIDTQPKAVEISGTILSSQT